MSKLKGLAEWAGLIQSHRYDDEDEFPAAEATAEVAGPESETQAVPVAREAAVVPIEGARSRRAGLVREVNLGEITTIQPRTYNSDARKIAESYRDGVPVIVNMSDMETSEAFRLIDFMAGLQTAVDGTLKKITARVFLLAPPAVKVTDRDVERFATTGLIAQAL
jgi:cell division inhibitor SepF